MPYVGKSLIINMIQSVNEVNERILNVITHVDYENILLLPDYVYDIIKI